MADPLDSVKQTVRDYRRWAKQQADKGDPTSEKATLQIAADLEAVVSELTALRVKAAPLPTKLGDLSDIPPELRAELSGVELDQLEGQLVTVINSYGGTADLNQILVGLYRKFKIVQKRRVAQQRLWRMQQDKLVFAVPKKKGTYSTKQQAEDNDVFGFSTPSKKPKISKDLDDDIPF